MRRKIANTIDDALYQQIKRLAKRDDKPINQIIEESLREYLHRRRESGSVVQETQGTYSVSPELVRQVVEEDLYDSE